MIVQMKSGCTEECWVRVMAYDEGDGMTAVVQHGNASGAEYVNVGVLPLHQGIDPEAVAAFEAIGETLSALHEGA